MFLMHARPVSTFTRKLHDATARNLPAQSLVCFRVLQLRRMPLPKRSLAAGNFHRQPEGAPAGRQYLVCDVSDRCLTLSVSFSPHCVPGLRVMPRLLRPGRSSHSYLCYLKERLSGPQRGQGDQSLIPAANQLIHSSVDLILFSALPDRSYRVLVFRWVEMRKTRREAPGDSPDRPRARFHSICFAEADLSFRLPDRSCLRSDRSCRVLDPSFLAPARKQACGLNTTRF